MVVERIRDGIFSPEIIFDEDWSLSIWDLFFLLSLWTCQRVFFRVRILLRILSFFKSLIFVWTVTSIGVSSARSVQKLELLMYLIVILVVSISYVKALVILFASSKERKLVPKCQLSTKK
jgi:hypothetical protein